MHFELPDGRVVEVLARVLSRDAEDGCKGTLHTTVKEYNRRLAERPEELES